MIMKLIKCRVVWRKLFSYRYISWKKIHESERCRPNDDFNVSVVRFPVLIATSIKMALFWNLAPSRLEMWTDDSPDNGSGKLL
jgi:hypothetical protein